MSSYANITAAKPESRAIFPEQAPNSASGHHRLTGGRADGGVDFPGGEHNL